MADEESKWKTIFREKRGKSLNIVTLLMDCLIVPTTKDMNQIHLFLFKMHNLLYLMCQSEENTIGSKSKSHI